MSETMIEDIFPMEIWRLFVVAIPRIYGIVSGLSRRHYGVLRGELEHFKLATCQPFEDEFGHLCGVLPNGKRHGKSRRTYLGGAIRDEIDFVDGVIHGEWRDYYGDGKVEKIEKWEGGRRNGEYTRYWPSGALKTRGWQINDSHHGHWFTYNGEGVITWQYDYCRNGCKHDMIARL